MLDSLGSTLTSATVDSFFTRYGKSHEKDDLTVDEAVLCLEAEIMRPNSEKKLVSAHGAPSMLTGLLTPSIHLPDLPAVDPSHSSMEYVSSAGTSEAAGTPEQQVIEDQREPNQKVLSGQGSGPSPDPENCQVSTPENASGASSDNDNEVCEEPSQGISTVERVVNIKTCPLCHRPRLNSKAEVDIITHLGICASSDWNRVNRIVVGDYVTASQAQRKWYTKVITKVSSGAYQLGAVSASLAFCAHCWLIGLVELGKHHCAKSPHRAIRRRENASLCPSWYPTFV